MPQFPHLQIVMTFASQGWGGDSMRGTQSLLGHRAQGCSPSWLLPAALGSASGWTFPPAPASSVGGQIVRIGDAGVKCLTGVGAADLAFSDLHGVNNPSTWSSGYQRRRSGEAGLAAQHPRAPLPRTVTCRSQEHKQQADVGTELGSHSSECYLCL